MSTPDRFEMAVESFVKDTARTGYYLNGPAMLRTDAVKILRREHNSVLRLIKALIAEVERGSPCQENTTYALALRDILAAMDKRRK